MAPLAADRVCGLPARADLAGNAARWAALLLDGGWSSRPASTPPSPCASGALRIVTSRARSRARSPGTVILAAGGWGAYALLWAFFLAGDRGDALGLPRASAARGIAQSHERPARRAATSSRTAASRPRSFSSRAPHAFAFAARASPPLSRTRSAPRSGLSTAAGAFSPLTLRAGPGGTPGAISWPGTLAEPGGSRARSARGAGASGWSPLSLAPASRSPADSWARSRRASLTSLAARFGARLDHEFSNALNTFVGAMSREFALGCGESPSDSWRKRREALPPPRAAVHAPAAAPRYRLGRDLRLRLRAQPRSRAPRHLGGGPDGRDRLAVRVRS